MLTNQRICAIALALVSLSCQPAKEMKTIGSIERLDPSLDAVVDPKAVVEIISEGHEWSEGPLWLEDQKTLLFSDVPKNTIYQWTESTGTSVYLTPSGWTGSDSLKREGSNGLLLDNAGNLVLCQHGDRRMAIMEAPLNKPTASFKTLAGMFDGKRFNSPNDATFHGGDLYFTDPPYGLPKQMEDPSKEIPYQGVFRMTPAGDVSLLVDSLTYPNGIAFSPAGDFVYVANSDPHKARWYRYRVEAGNLADGIIFYDATALTATEKGLPDGMKINKQGILFGSGPGGVFIFNPEGQLIGKIKLADAASNCALSADEKTLYVTNDMYILRIKLKS